MQFHKAHLFQPIAGPRSWRRAVALFSTCIVLGIIVPRATAANHKDDQKLEFLVARTQVRDPFFAKSVVLILPIDGTPIEVGLILNKTSRVPLSTLFPQSPAVAARKEPVHFGGPVDVHVPGMIFHSATQPDNSLHLYGDVYFIFDADQISALLQTLPASSKMLFFLGRAQWLPDQLRNEIHRGDWDRLQLDGKFIFSADPKTMWERLRTQGVLGKSIPFQQPSHKSPATAPLQLAEIGR